MAEGRQKYVRIAVDDSADHAYRTPDVWDTTVIWTPGDVTTALQEADSGQLQLAADLCDGQWTDDRARGTMQTRVGALLGLNNDEKLEFASDSARIRKAIKADWWISAPETELGKLIRWGLHLGIGFAQRRVVKNEGRWVPRLQTWNPRSFTLDLASGLWRTYTRNDGTVEIRPDDPHWVTFCPYGEDRPWAEGTWRAIALYWLIKTYGLRSWGKHNDVHGSGAIVGKTPPIGDNQTGVSCSDGDRQKFWADLKSMGRNARIVLPEGYSIEILEAKAATEDTFVKSGERADTAIAIVHLGQPMTTEIKGSPQTGADNARAVRQDYLEFDAEQLSTWVHDRHLPAWAAWNFSDANLAPWPRFNANPPVNLQLEANTLVALGNALEKLRTVAPEGQDVDTETMFYRYNIPLRKKPAGEPAVVQVPAVVAPPQPEQPPKE